MTMQAEAPSNIPSCKAQTKEERGGFTVNDVDGDGGGDDTVTKRRDWG